MAMLAKVAQNNMAESFINQISREVGHNNKLALKVIRELMWFGDWEKLMKWLKTKPELQGGKLYDLYYNQFDKNWHACGIHLMGLMEKDMRRQRFLDIIKSVVSFRKNVKS